MKATARKTSAGPRFTVFEDLKTALRGCDLAWVGEASGVAPRTLYFWLSGQTTRPRLDTLVKVAVALGYTVELRRAQGGARHLRVVK